MKYSRYTERHVKTIADKVENVVAKVFYCTIDDLHRPDKKRPFIFYRQITRYVAAKVLDQKYCVAKHYKLNNATILHSVKQVEDYMSVYDDETTDKILKCLKLCIGKPRTEVIIEELTIFLFNEGVAMDIVKQVATKLVDRYNFNT